MRPLRNGADVEGSCGDAGAALLIDNFAYATLVYLCQDPPTAQIGALYFANLLLALLNSRPVAWCPHHHSLQHIRCIWAAPCHSTGTIGQRGQVARPGIATHHADGVLLLHACSAHGAWVHMCMSVGCSCHAEAKCALQCCIDVPTVLLSATKLIQSPNHVLSAVERQLSSAY